MKTDAESPSQPTRGYLTPELLMTDEETYTCEACEKEFDTKAALERHMREVGLVD